MEKQVYCHDSFSAGQAFCYLYIKYIHAILLISVYIDIPTQSEYLLKLHSLASLALYVSSYSTYVYFEAGGEDKQKYEEFR